MTDPFDIAATMLVALLLPLLLLRGYRVLKGYVSLHPEPWVRPAAENGPLRAASALLLVFLAMFAVHALIPVSLAGLAYLVTQYLLGEVPVAGMTAPSVAAIAVGANALVWLTRSDRHTGLVWATAGLAWAVARLSVGDVIVVGTTAPVVAAAVAGICCLVLMAWSAAVAR